MTIQKMISAAAASTALVFTGMTPAMAAPVNAVPVSSAPVDVDNIAWNSAAESAQGWRNRGYRGYRGHRRHRNRINGGDVLTGILILGGIAAIAGAASNSKKRDRRYEERDNSRYDRRSSDRRSASASDSIDSAINACSSAAERAAGENARVSEIQSVSRDGVGWRVEGYLTGSAKPTFQCGATNGNVDFVQLGAENLASAN